ncbi:hypothetical protein EHS25_000356 [Saitozyma podzolica]|uniref:Elongator complex protein 1 n=1 Tax=Saitozyma podzolica TaxID=1890683 RepID=A0A427YVW8_9TREE|nr:hypothetical protein EHS25_000356 [Saitozyma podzolica]
MRSLTPTSLSIFPISSSPSNRVVALAVDPESPASFFAALERVSLDGVQVDLIRLSDDDNAHDRLASVDSPVLAPFPLPEYRGQVVDLKYLADERTLVVLLAGGDIATVNLEGPDGGVAPVEIVGSVDSGIKAAAWSPDEEQLILVTGEDMLVCMTRNFDLIHEEPLRQEDFGEDKFINVGWGSKTTQFHGTLGKAAAREPGPSSSTSSSRAHHTDDSLPTITFRGDAAFFAVSSLDPYPFDGDAARRQVRIYSRDSSAGFAPRLSATSEVLPGLEGPLAWRPSGNVISGLVRYGYPGGGVGTEGRWEVAMLERNGLRHGGFPLREGEKVWQDGRVRGMKWNADSEVLAIWIERENEDVVQLWSMKNYHYYLKQELFSSNPSQPRFNGFMWHPEKPLSLYIIGQDHVQTRSFVWDTYAARLPMPNDTAAVVVVDGDRLLITPFRTQNTPPPMSSCTISLPSTPVHVSVSNDEDALAVLLRDGRVQLWDLHTRLPGPKGSKLRGGGKVAEPVLRWEKRLEMEGRWSSRLVWVLWSERGWLILEAEGRLRTLSDDPFEAFLCANPTSIAVTSAPLLAIALSPSGKLLVASLSADSSDPITLASSVNSFTTTPSFLVYTTTSQTSFYAPLPVVAALASGEDVPPHEKEWETRRVERGSLIVTACPSEMSLVLQMPRGNLETVYPRPLVLAVVRRDVLAGKFRAAFLTCRKHRLDLNLLYDLEPARFMASLSDFIEQIPEVDYLNLFVSSLSEEDSARALYQDLGRVERTTAGNAEKVNSICDSLRNLLEQKDLVRYIETVLTTHVCKRPADYEAGLRVLLHLQAEHPDIVEDAIKFIIFLSDVDRLYDVALGMYNFQLVLMIAQYSQKDPKEYLPFLRELRALDRYEQRFRIDDHLGRRESALRNLKEAGPERFDDAASYLARYELYDDAFKLYATDTERLPVIYDLYGDYLYDRREFAEAALAYTLANNCEKALKAHEKAHSWQELFTLALQQKLPKQAIVDMCGRVTDHLASRGRHTEAARVFVEYASDVDSAVDVLCRGTDFAEAYRLASLHDREDLVESVIHPGLDDAQEALLEVFEEMEGQLDKEVARLAELRKIRTEDPDTFFIVDNEPALEGVDVATNATTVMTTFTRYTVAPTTVMSQSTRITGQTNKSKHRPSKRRQAGRKGTVDEWEYLLGSMGRLVARVDEKSGERFHFSTYFDMVKTETVYRAEGSTPDHKELAKSLQSTILDFRQKLASALDDAWRDREAILQETEDSGGMGLGGDVKKAKEEVRPEVKGWKGLGVLVG